MARNHFCACLLLSLAAILGPLALVGAIEAIPQAADTVTMVNADSPKDVRLEANLAIPDGGELVLSIQVPHEAVKLHSHGPAKVTRVYSDHADGKYGVGEVIHIFVEFTSAVQIVGKGAPWLLLRTGCHDSPCHVREVQRLRCQATKGKFALAFDGQKVGNVPWDATQKVLAAYIQRMTRIDKVSVEYSIDEDRACTFFGNNITITYESMNIAGTDGDLSEMIGDSNNLVGDGVVLEHIQYPPAISATAWELQKGVLIPDRRAQFVAQTAPNTLQFAYTVQKGDNTSRLEYANSDSLALSLRAAGGARILNADESQIQVNAILPPPGFAGDWERGLGSSLSTHNALTINVSPPYVTTVTSPHVDGTFGIGEEILVHVHFSQPIVVSGLPTVVFETGTVDRIIPFSQVVLPERTIAEFRYIVQSMDTSPDLTYTSTDALQLNGGSIKRQSTTPTTSAILKLPANGESGSLSVNKNIVIDTTNPQVQSVSTTAAGGTYTAGDEIPIVVTFDVPVVVTGTPQLLLNTGTVNLFPGEFVQAAPTLSSAKTVIFPSVDHGLTTLLSRGLQFQIGGQILTVDYVNGDEVTMLEDYTATVVDPRNIVGRANISIKTPGYRPANYNSGSGTTSLVFVYAVQVGDVSTRLDYVSTAALQVGSGSIKRLSSTPFMDADITLDVPGTVGSLGFGSSIMVNTDAPVVSRVTATSRNGVYKAGDSIDFEVEFNLAVVVFPTASVLTNVGTSGTERFAVYAKGSGSKNLKFRFQCIAADDAAVFDYVGVKALRASYGSSSGWIRRKSASPLVPAVLDLPAIGLSSKLISIRQGCAVVVDVFTTHEDGTFGVGEVIDFQIKYSVAVDVDTSNGIPTMTTSTGNQAIYDSGNGIATLSFLYVVQASDIAGQLNYPDRFALVMNGGSVKATADSSLASTILPLPELSSLGSESQIFVQTSPPVVRAVSTRIQDRVITVGDTIVLYVDFTSPVMVPSLSTGAGVPTLLLNVGTGTEVASSFIAAEYNAVYFSHTVGTGESTNNLAYVGRTALKCIGGSGLNQNAAQNAGFPSTVVFHGRVFASWTEVSSATSTWQIRVKSFDFQQFPPLSSFEDGGGSSSILSFPLGLGASAPNFVVFASKLYLLWEEANSATNNPTQIRVAVLSSRTNGGSAAQWTIVDNTPTDSSGINKVPTENAAAPHGVAHNSKLYTAWQENAGGIPQIRVAVYNGLDVTPGWTFVDGNQFARGLNYDTSKSAGKVRLCSCASRLYAAWEEAAPATGKSQIRVAAQTGEDISPNWKLIDGNGATGLNINTLMAANAPSIACLGGTAVIVAWHEATTGIGSIIWAKKFSGDLTSPMWTRLDSGSGLNYDATQGAKNVHLSVQLLGTTDILYATWDEVDATSSFSQIRVAKFTISSAITSWKFLDGNARLSSVNEDVTHAASRPMLTFGQSPDAIFAFWQENHSTGKTHIRSSMLGSSVWEWQPIIQACILRRSTSSVTAANLLLPEVNTPGSLDFTHSIQVETSVPVVESMYFIGEMESAVTLVNMIQTIDVFNTGSLTQGEYKLIYGHLSETPCIDWDAPASGVGSVEAALNSIVGLALTVSVVKDASAFLDGHRYTVTFAFPSMGLQSLQPKRVPDASCKAFVCLPTAMLPCNIGLVQTNQNADVRVGVGIVDTVVYFSSPVEVQIGIPKLTLDAGTADRDAVYSTRSALQEFDVGVDSASPLLAGAFRLSYGDFSNGVGAGTIITTDCIQILPNDEDGVQEMQAKLEAIALLNTIGIRTATRRKVRNGYRYGIEFRNSGDLLDLVPADSTDCLAVSGRIQTIDISADSEILAGEILVQLGDATSSCISWDLRAKGSTNSMEAFLSSMDNGRIIPLQIVKDPSAFAYGVKYYVSFMLRDDAKQPLIVSSDAACVAFTCDDGNGTSTTCSGLSIAANADFRVSRAASEALSFRYLVQSSDETASLTYKNSLSLTGSIVRASMSPTVAALLTLPQPRDALLSESRASSVSIVSINTIPVVVKVSSTTLDDTYTAGDVILVLVEFSGTVEVDGKPILELDSNGKAFFVSGGATSVLKFYYKVEAGDTSSDLNYASEAALRTFTTPESRIRCGLCSSLLIDASLALPSLLSVSSLAANSALIIDTTIPTIVEISSSRPDTVAGDAGYGPGDILDIIVEFSADVVVSGIPTLSLNSGGTAAFTYAGYRQLIDVGVNAVAPVTSGQFSIVYNGGSSGCIDFDDADSSASTSLKSQLLEFPAIARIGVTSVTLTRKKNGNRFVILFDSTKVVDVPMAIGLALSDVCEPLYPSSTAPELLVSRSTDRFVVFHYTVEVGETVALLNAAGTAISLAGGDKSIKRRAGSPFINADLTLPDPTGPHGLAQKKNLAIDGAEVKILDIVSDSTAQTYGVAFPSTASPPTVGPGEVLFHLVFSRPVKVIGSPTVELATGSLRPNGEFIPNRFAKFAGQPQPDHVAFLYHVEREDYSSNLAFVSRNGLADAEIYCVASTMAVRATTLLPRFTVSDSSVIEIDAYSVPTTVKLASSQGDGVYGAGELIEIQVTFSKQVVLLTGLNHNLDWHARYPIALEFQNWIYIMWTECDDLHTPTKSYLYMRVFTSGTLDVVPMVSTSPINRSPDTFIEKVTMTIWFGDIYAAWDEGGLLYCARFEGVTSPFPWTLIPNMGVNNDMEMTASDPVLIVYNLELVVIWRELAVPVGGTNPVGHIHVAVRNDDNNAPLWIFHDGNQLQSGLNNNALMDADDPTAVVYRGRLYVSWSEMNEAGAYEIVIARRNMQTRDFSTWTYLEALPSTYPAYNFLSAYHPQLVVRRKGLEDMALLITWYRDTTTSNFSEVVTGQVLDLDWEASVTGSIPQTINAAELNSSIDGANPNTKQQQLLTCGDSVYASWLGLEGASSEESAYVVKLATLPSGSDVYTGWTAAGTQYNLNQNPKFDAMDSFLICSSSTSANPQVGLVWAEYDGYSMKLRFRHSSIVPRIPGISASSFGEVTAGAPILILATQSNPTGFAACINMSGLTAYTLTFAYVVQPGESTPNLEILGSDALRLNGGEIRDVYGQTPDFTLFPDSTDLRSLAYNSQLVIDTTPPTVSGVTTVNPSGEYGVGELFLLQVAFTNAVIVFEGDLANIPTLHLRSDELHQMTDSQGLATYTGGSGTNVLTFEYTTTQQDYCERFDYLDSGSLSLNGEGWTIKRKSTRPIVDAILTLPTPKSTHSLSGNRLIAIKPTQPRILSVSSSTPDGVYYPGDTILVDVVFSLPVVVFGFPVLLLATGDEDTRASLTSGNESATLTFQYDIKKGDSSARLDVVDDRHGNDQVYFVMSLELAGYSEIKRVSTNPYTSAILALPAPGLAGSLSANKNIVVDSTPPAVLDIRSPVLDGTYDVGETIDILMNFSRRVVVIGTPELILNVPALATRTAVYIDGSETDTLRFSYTPEEGDNSMNVALDFQNEYSLILRPLLDGMEFLQAPAQIIGLSANPMLAVDLMLPLPGVAVRADAVLSLVGNNQKIFVRTDGFHVQGVVADIPNGVYSPGQRIVISVLFTGPAVVQGVPQIKLNANALSFAMYFGGTGTARLQFEYIVATGDSCSVLEAASRSALELNGGVISDSKGIYAPLRLRAPSLPGSLSYEYRLEISSTPPVVERVYCQNGDGDYGVGDVLHLTIQFSRKVVIEDPAVASPPSLRLLLDTGFRTANYLTGDGTNTLVFSIQVVNGDSAHRLDYADASSLFGTIYAMATTPTTQVNLLLPTPGVDGSLSDSSAVRVISTPPTVESVTAVSRNGTYGLNDQLYIRVHFSFPVLVTTASSCVLKLSVGDLERRRAVYTGGSTTNILTFVYTVESGDHSAHLDYAGSESLTCSVLQSTAAPSLSASPLLALPGASASLGFSSAFRIDASSPRIVSVSSDLPNGVYGAGQVIDISVAFSEAVLVTKGGVPRLRLAIASNAVVDALLETAVEPFATYIGGSGTATLRFTYTTREGDMALPLMYAGIDALSMVPEGVQVTAAAIGQSAFRFATLRLPAPGATGSFSNNRDIHIDTLEPPRVLRVGSPMPDRIYTAGDTLELSVAFSMPVTVIGTAPTLLLQTGNVESSDGEKKAIYVSGSGTSVLLFEYEIQVGDRTDRLDYRPCPFAERRAPERREWDKLVICSSAANALQLEGTSGRVKRTSTFPTTDAVLDLPEVTDWAQVRFQTSHDEVVYVTQLEPTTDIPEADRTLSQPPVSEFTMTQQRTAITMYSNGIPDHKTTLLERLKEQRYFIELQRFPTQQSNPLVLSEVPDKFTGIFLNGIPFKSLSSSEQATDDCGGAIDADNRYFYVTLPVCYLAMAHEPREAPVSSQASTSNSRPPSIVVAYALDGFPIYGFYNEDGELPSDLDECNGRVRRDGQYGYHLVPPDTPSASPFMPCSKGIDATSASQDQLEVFRYPADVAAVEGLSLSRLSRFDGLVIDETSTAEHATTWLNPDGVSVVYTSTSVIVRSTGVPPTGSYGPFPNAYNRFIVSEQDYVFQFSRHPMVSATTTPLPLDAPIGVLLNGVPFFASDSEIYGGNVLDSANPAYVLMDRCNGLVDAGGDYRYYASPDCLLDQLGDVADQPSPLLGFAFDGFPLYGPYDENGQIPDDLDVCNGRTGDDGTYRYHVTLTSPYLLGCFRGELSTDETGDLYRSLSYAHALRINTDRPRVAHVFTNKRPGTYVAGESIDVVVEWSTPVQIDWAGGLPSLAIQNSPRVAIYDPSRSSATSSSFMLTVTSGDFDIEDFSYDPHVPIQLNGARIARLAALPVLDADLKLVPIDLDDTNLMRTGTSGLASKFQLVRSLRVELRGMYHPRAADLRARVFHGRRQSIIFDGCCAPRDAFGIPDVPDVLINRAQLGSEPRNPTSGVGWDYNFADFDGLDNLALDGGATVLQSSTSGMCVASNAIDGRIRGVGVATQTVARTHPAEDEHESAWWELRLLESHPIGTIRVWIPEREPELPAVVFTLRVDASDGVSPVTGHFTLMFTTPNGHQQINTEPISHNAVAMVVDENPRATTPGIGLGESLQAKLTALGELMPRLFVTRDPRDAAMSDNGAFTWHITFLDSTRIASSVLSVGANAVCDGTGVVELTVPSPIDDGSDPVMYRDEKAGTPTNSTGQKASEQSMFPFWVLLFEHSAVMDVESFADAYDRAVFSYRVDGSQANRSVIAVVPSAGTIAQYVRLVAELPRGVLSLAEVEVFAEQTHVLSQYRGGTPVRAAYYPGAKTWSPEEPFKYVFGGMPSEGAWTLAIADMAANGSTNLKANATAGGISDWTLHVTNEAGETRAYFMDFQAQLHALPRHGTLFVALDGTERDHLDVDANGLLDSMEADVYLSRYSPTGYSALPALTRERELQQFLLNYDTFGGVEVLRDPSERQKRLPSRVCDSACLQALGVDPYFYVGLEGDVALKLLRVVGDRVVKYVPQPGFRGKDAFTFSVAVGGQESRVLGTIQLTVKECEDPDCHMANFFLHRSTR